VLVAAIDDDSQGAAVVLGHWADVAFYGR
jgi:hypothetical protein